MGCSSQTVKPLGSEASKSPLSISIRSLWLSSLFVQPIHPINNSGVHPFLWCFSALAVLLIDSESSSQMRRPSLEGVFVIWLKYTDQNWESIIPTLHPLCCVAKSSLRLGFFSSRFLPVQINYQRAHTLISPTHCKPQKCDRWQIPCVIRGGNHQRSCILPLSYHILRFSANPVPTMFLPIEITFSHHMCLIHGWWIYRLTLSLVHSNFLLFFVVTLSC